MLVPSLTAMGVLRDTGIWKDVQGPLKLLQEDESAAYPTIRSKFKKCISEQLKRAKEQDNHSASTLLSLALHALPSSQNKTINIPEAMKEAHNCVTLRRLPPESNPEMQEALRDIWKKHALNADAPAPTKTKPQETKISTKKTLSTPMKSQAKPVRKYDALLKIIRAYNEKNKS